MRVLCAFLGLISLTVTAATQVPYERIRNTEPQHWLTYSGNYQSHRFSPLKQINRTNVARLKPTWIYQMRDSSKVETTPLVVDGIIYLTEKPHVVTALDGTTGTPLWTYRRTTPADTRGCCGTPNRGLAILNDTLYLCTFDAHLVALEAKTGKLKWDVVVADYKTGYSMTGAPLAIKDKIIVGVAGGEFGVRGFLDAYSPQDGERLWRFWTVPATGEKGNETWAGESWKTGGAPTWLTGSYDAALNLIYWGTGNPAPDWNGDSRAGDNLYSDSLLALDADTGRLRWHFQFTPHDTHDWDANQIPILLDEMMDGRLRKLVVTANRNGFYYVLDRTTGEFLRGASYIKQTWAKGLDAKGRPLTLPNIEPTTQGTLLYPSIWGGTNWNSPSFSPQTKLFYVLAADNDPQYFVKEDTVYHAGELFMGGEGRNVPGITGYGAVRALDVTTGLKKWEYKLPTRVMAGVMATAGGLVFGGSREGYFYALDAATGKQLWQFMTGAQIAANPISYSMRGKQFVAIVAGNGLFVFGL